MTTTDSGPTIGKYSSKAFTSTFLPTATSFGSNLRAFQSNFPVSTSKPNVIDPSGANVIVLQPGSRFMKIGFANQAFPQLVPHVLARSSVSERENGEKFDWSVDEDAVQERIAQRYRQSRRKPPPNIYQSLMNYNRQSDYEEISAHNDAFPVEWTEVSAGKRFYVGRDALHLNPSENFTLFWPFKNGTFNNCDYSRLEEVVDDLGILWRGVIEAELGVKSTEFCNYSLVLVLPDSFERAELKACVSAALGKEAPFRAVSVIQESQAVAFGCGVSSGVVVDFGAQKISVACVEEGFVALETRVVLPIGGDNITRLFGELLRIHEFPYEFDLTNPLDWALLDDLKERCCTVNEAEIAPSAAIFEVYVRKPSELTRKFLFKMFEERIMAPMELFEPEMGLLHEQCEAQNHPGLLVNAFDFEDSFVEPITDDGGVVSVVTDTANARSISCCWDSCGASFEELSAALEHFESVHFAAYTGDSCKCGNCSYSCVDRLSLQCHVIGTHFMPSSIDVKTVIGDLKTRLADRFHSVPLSVDEAVMESLVRLGDSERIKRCVSSVILSGGSHLFSGFPDVLYSALSAKLPQNPLTALLEAKIFPNARDLDARFLAWKGGAVFCRLESTSEAWITCGEWDLFGVRSIKEKVSFIN